MFHTIIAFRKVICYTVHIIPAGRRYYERILAGVASLALILSVLLPAAGFNLPTRIERVTADSCNLFSDNSKGIA